MANLTDLITMADVARLAGQQRSTVGNWKRRDATFPSERGKGPKGPLYDRSEVMQWLSQSGRLPAPIQQRVDPFLVFHHLRDNFSIEDSLMIILALLAMRSQKADEEWMRFADADPHDSEREMQNFAIKYLKTARPVLPQELHIERGFRELFQEISALPLASLPSVADESLDSFLNSRLNFSRGAGANLTPASVCQLVAGLAGAPKRVYDPSSGAGRLLIATAVAGKATSPELFGQELSEWNSAISLLNMMIHGVEGQIKTDNVFFRDRFPDLKTDVVVSSPPWNLRIAGVEELTNDPRWIWGPPGPNGGNMAWVQHCLSHLSEGGRAIIVMPPAVQFESGISGRIRQGIIKSGYLDAVISLPPRLFNWTSLAAVVLVFKKGRPSVDGMPAPTLMINLEDLDVDDGRRRRTLPPELISTVLNVYRLWSEGGQPEVEFARAVTYADLAESDFNISPRRFIAPPQEVQNPKEIEERLVTAHNALLSALRASRERDDLLTHLLGGK